MASRPLQALACFQSLSPNTFLYAFQRYLQTFFRSVFTNFFPKKEIASAFTNLFPNKKIAIPPRGGRYAPGYFPKGSCAPRVYVLLSSFFLLQNYFWLHKIKDLDKIVFLEISSEQYWLRTSTYKIKGSYDRTSTHKNWTFVIMHMAFAPKLFSIISN